MHYSEQHKADVERLAEEKQAANDMEQIYLLYKRNRSIVACQANTRLILQHFNGDEIENEAMLDEAIQHPALKATLAYQTPAQDREKLESEIESLLVGSSEAIRGQVASFRYKDVHELEKWRNELRSRRELSTMTASELREIIKRPAKEYPDISKTMYRSRTMILAASPDEIRQCIKTFGLSQVNAVLAQPSRDE